MRYPAPSSATSPERAAPPTAAPARRRAAGSPDGPDVSVVVPFYEEGENASTLVRELRDVLGALSRSWELVLVDDGSRDDTFERLSAASAGEARCAVLRLARNYGQTAALAAGLARARGAVLVLLDGDGQNDPRDIPRLLDRVDEGWDLVSGWRRQRRDALFSRKLPSRAANALVARLSGVPLHDFGCSLKAYRRPYLEGVRLYGEMHRFLAIHAAWEGARLTELEVNHRPRTAGQSKYGLERTFKVILDLTVLMFFRRYATKPIYLFGGFGLASLAASFLAGLLALWFKYADVIAAWFGADGAAQQKDFVETPLPLLVVMFALVGVLSVLMGLLAEMLTRTYHESQEKPVYRLAEVVLGSEVRTPVEDPS